MGPFSAQHSPGCIVAATGSLGTALELTVTGPPLVTLQPHGTGSSLSCRLPPGGAWLSMLGVPLTCIHCGPSLLCPIWKVVRRSCVSTVPWLCRSDLPVSTSAGRGPPYPAPPWPTGRENVAVRDANAKFLSSGGRGQASSHQQSGSSTGGHPTSWSKQVTSGYRSRDYCSVFPSAQDPWKVGGSHRLPSTVSASQDTRCQQGCSPPAVSLPPS